jgi:hypothetical protein
MTCPPGKSSQSGASFALPALQGNSLLRLLDAKIAQSDHIVTLTVQHIVSSVLQESSMTSLEAALASNVQKETSLLKEALPVDVH